MCHLARPFPCLKGEGHEFASTIPPHAGVAHCIYVLALDGRLLDGLTADLRSINFAKVNPERGRDGLLLSSQSSYLVSTAIQNDALVSCCQLWKLFLDRRFLGVLRRSVYVFWAALAVCGVKSDLVALSILVRLR